MTARAAFQPPESNALETLMLSIRVNGDPRRVAASLTLAGLARELGLDPARIAIERNRQVVARSRLDAVSLEEGDAIEIVTFVGGG